MKIQFRRPWRQYEAGQIVDLPDEGLADAYVRSGAAVRVALAPEPADKPRQVRRETKRT